jgi:hypothetical protein
MKGNTERQKRTKKERDKEGEKRGNEKKKETGDEKNSLLSYVSTSFTMNTQCLMQVGETLWPEHIHMALSVFT